MMGAPGTTPGTWIFEPHNGYGSVDPDGVPWPVGYISEGIGKPIFGLEDVLVRGGTEMRANAHQLAASPDMYDALSDLMENPTFVVSVGGNPNVVDAMLDRARTALAKARGQ